MNQFSTEPKSKFGLYFIMSVAVFLSIVVVTIFIIMIFSDQTIDTDNQGNDKNTVVQNDDKKEEDNDDRQSQTEDIIDENNKEDDTDIKEEEKVEERDNDQDRQSDIDETKKTTYVRYLALENTRNCDLGSFNNRPNQPTNFKKFIADRLAYYHSVFGTSVSSERHISRDDFIKVLKDHLFKTGQGDIQNPLNDFTKDLSNKYANHTYTFQNAPYYNKNYYDIYFNALKDLDGYIVGYCFQTKDPQTNELDYVFQPLDLSEVDYVANNYTSNYSASEFKNPTARKQEILDDIAQALGLTVRGKKILNSINVEFRHYMDFDSEYKYNCDGCWSVNLNTMWASVAPIYDGYRGPMSIFTHEFLHAVFDYDFKHSPDRNTIIKELIKLYFETDEWRHRFEPNVYKQFFTVKLEDKNRVLKWLDENDNSNLEDYGQIGFHENALTELYASAGINIFADISGDDYNNPILYNHYSKYFKDWKGLGKKMYSNENIEQSDFYPIINKLTDYVLRGHH